MFYKQEGLNMIYKFKLLHNEDRGKIDLIRLLFAYANQDYESVRVKSMINEAGADECIQKYKAFMPFEQLPLLVVVVNDSPPLYLSQPIVIGRFLAKCFMLNGANDFESIQCDMVVEQLRELIDSFYLIQVKSSAQALNRNKKLNLSKREECIMTNTCTNDLLTKTLNGIEKMLQSNYGKFIVGKQLTWADLTIVNAWEWLFDDETFSGLLQQYAHVRAHNDFIRSIKPIGEWFKMQKPLSVSKNV